MERIRQDFVYGDRDPLAYYSDEELGNLYIKTHAELTQSTWGENSIYYVVLKSRMRNSTSQLTSEFVFTDIGEYKVIEEVTGLA